MRIAGRPLNPVLARELKERLRTRRATIVVTAYLAVLALILHIVYSALSRTTDVFTDTLATQSAQLGRSLFETLLFFMLLLVSFIVPGMTADAITGERERQTLVPLQVTLLSPAAILTGKLLSSLAFVTLLVLATLPLLGISFILGGVSVGQMARGVATVLATGLVLACVALACSSLARRTQGAMVLAYGATLFLVVGAPLIYGAQRALDDEGPHPTLAVLTLSPFFAAADATGAAGFAGPSATSPLEPMRQLIASEEEGGQFRGEFGGASGRGQVFIDGGMVEEEVFIDDGRMSGEVSPPVAIGPGGFPLEPGLPGRIGAGGDGVMVPFWVRSAGALGLVAAVSFAVAARRLRIPSTRATT